MPPWPRIPSTGMWPSRGRRSPCRPGQGFPRLGCGRSAWRRIASRHSRICGLLTRGVTDGTNSLPFRVKIRGASAAVSLAMAISRRAFLAGIPLVGIGGFATLAELKLNPHTPIDYALPAEPAMPPTPECLDHDHHATQAVTEGPFYKPDTPDRRMLRVVDRR